MCTKRHNSFYRQTDCRRPPRVLMAINSAAAPAASGSGLLGFLRGLTASKESLPSAPPPPARGGGGVYEDDALVGVAGVPMGQGDMGALSGVLFRGFLARLRLHRDRLAALGVNAHPRP